MAKGGKRRGGTTWSFADCRRLAIDLAVAAGLGRDQAVALANHLLWFDAAAAHSLGIASLPSWLQRVRDGEFQSTAETKFLSERAGTAVIDGQQGIPPLVLFRAAGIAGEKARELGTGLVVVRGLGPAPSAAPQAADLALGPFAAVLLGPEGAWSLAVPSGGGLPHVSDAVWGDADDPRPRPWGSLVPQDGWLVAALDVSVLGTLGESRPRGAAAGLDTTKWEAARAALHERGLALTGKVVKELSRAAEALGVALPPALDLS